MNKCMFTGNLGADPESRVAGNGTQIANFKIGCSCGYGEHKRTEWISCVAFGKTAELVINHLNKGSKVLIETELKTDKWKDKDGNDRYGQSYIVNNIEFLSKKADSGGQGYSEPPVGGSTGPDLPF